ncbi:hypothetical protein KCP70_15490 [Salmonella enterica subsp. enterica]|nr:hypothetical protein KCP70_15490 [Salmonella enterica subsp. enterica]
MVRRRFTPVFLNAVNFVSGNSDADPEQEVISRWRIEQCSELSAVSAHILLRRRSGWRCFSGRRIMLANTCTQTIAR